MKIPETSANIGAYYGNEENGQWQPNGVIIDSGVGGGIVGSGDAGIHPPPPPAVYPVHIPRGDIPGGYVVAGPYYGGPAAGPYGAVPQPPPHPQDDFADYMWMENEEEFDKQVLQQLEEEALMEQCIEAMLEDEQRERHHRPRANGHHPTSSNGVPQSLEETVSRSTLNPLAAEFVPVRARLQPAAEEKQEPVEVSAAVETKPTVESTTREDDDPPTNKEVTQEPVPPHIEPPEVSAADIQPLDSDKQKQKLTKPRTEQKKPVKTEKSKPKVPVAKSDTKVAVKKKEVKSVKSDVRVEEKEDFPVVEAVKSQPLPVEETVQSGPKPINYAAAAKANKPKKSSPPPPLVTEKLLEKTEKKDKPVEKDKKPAKLKVEKVRKNSAK